MAHYGPNEAPPMPVRLYHMCAPASCDTTRYNLVYMFDPWLKNKILICESHTAV